MESRRLCADSLRINKSTLVADLRLESGQTFRDVLHKVRIRRSETPSTGNRLIDGGNFRLVGYVHQSYFTAKV